MSRSGAKQASSAAGSPERAPRRTRSRERSAGDLARLIARERVELPSEPEEDGAAAAPYAQGSRPARPPTRLEGMLRMLWAQAQQGDHKAVRCLLEYMEGKPSQTIIATVKQDDGQPPTADEMARWLASAERKVETWRKPDEV